MWAKQKQLGFTIVELLIVIVVIAILAAITLVAYNGVTGKANDAAVQSDLSSIGQKLQLFNVDNGYYPKTVADLTSLGLKVSKSSYATNPAVSVNVGYCQKSNYAGFAIFAMSKSGNRFVVTDAGKVTTDTTGTSWDQTNTTLGSQCTALGYTVPLTHGYVSSDTTAGPWRSWVGGN